MKVQAHHTQDYIDGFNAGLANCHYNLSSGASSASSSSASASASASASSNGQNPQCKFLCGSISR